LDRESVRASLTGITRAYFTYSVSDGCWKLQRFCYGRTRSGDRAGISSEMRSASAYDLIDATPTVREIVDTLSSVLQRPIRYVDITDEQWIEAMRDHINTHALDHLSHLWQYFRSTERRTGEARTVTDTIRAVTGSRA
jgi:hypothetical protein